MNINRLSIDVVLLYWFLMSWWSCRTFVLGWINWCGRVGLKRLCKYKFGDPAMNVLWWITSIKGDRYALWRFCNVGSAASEAVEGRWHVIIERWILGFCRISSSCCSSGVTILKLVMLAFVWIMTSKHLPKWFLSPIWSPTSSRTVL